MFRTFFRNASRITNVKPPVKMEVVEVPVILKTAAWLYTINEFGRCIRNISGPI